MKRLSIILTILLAPLFINAQTGLEKKTRIYQKNLKRIDKEFNKVNKEKERDEGKEEGEENPPDKYFQDLAKRTMNPETGIVESYKLQSINEEIKKGKYGAVKNLSMFGNNNTNLQSRSVANTQWIERGPYSVGGRTRALMYDPNDATGKRVFAGGISGGLWVNSDITSATSEWKQINDFLPNLSVSCLAYDPNNTQIMYAGTGEGSITSALVSGAGVFKSTDGGKTWTQIFNPSVSYTINGRRNGIYYVNSIKVRNNAGVSEVYVGVSGGYAGGVLNGTYDTGLYRSTDAGTTFTRLPSFYLARSGSTGLDIHCDIQQIEIGQDNSIWVSTKASQYASSGINSGGKIFRSTDGTNFSIVYDASLPRARVQIALSKTNPAVAYALMQGSTDPIRILKTSDTGITWKSTNDTTPAITLPQETDTSVAINDFTNGQSWYNLVIATNPSNDNEVYVGGLDLHKSNDGCATWSQISKWSNNNNLRNLKVSLVHADQHAIVFNPLNSSQMLFGNDGGVFYSANNSNFTDNSTNFNSTVPVRNSRYNVTQFYSVSIDQTSTQANEGLLAGAQDNGSQLLYGAPLASNMYSSVMASGGDGTGVAFSGDGTYIIMGYVYNVYSLYNFNTNTRSTIINDQTTGHFVNEMAFDKNLSILYTYKTGVTLSKYIDLTGVAVRSDIVVNASPSVGEEVSKIAVSPYTTGSSTLLVGTTIGKIYKVSNADTVPVATLLTTPAAGSISDVKFGANENEIIATYSNFGSSMVNIYYSNDAGVTWVSKENNFPDMPVYCVFMNPDDKNEVLIGTELGVWGTANFQSASPLWAQYTKGIGNVRVTAFDYRNSDNTLAVSTYGRGLFTTQSVDNLATSETKEREIMLVYPNPNTGNFAIKFNYRNFVKIEIFDASGRLVFTKDKVKSEEEINSGLSKGNYVLKASSVGQKVFSSFLIVK